MAVSQHKSFHKKTTLTFIRPPTDTVQVRWSGGKCLQYFIANLFRSLYQNWPSFVKDNDRNIWLTFFLGYGVYITELCVRYILKSLRNSFFAVWF